MTSLSALLFLLCFLTAHVHAGNSISKMLDPNGIIQPMIANVIFGGELEEEVDAVLNSIPNKMCVSHLKFVAEGLKTFQFWALKMVDSSTKIPQSLMSGLTTHMGDYDECLSVRDVSSLVGPFSGKHCLVRTCTSDTRRCINIPSIDRILDVVDEMDASKGQLLLTELLPKIRVALNTTMGRFALCVPSTCRAQDIETVINVAISLVTKQFQVNVEELECHTAEGTSYDSFDYFALWLLLSVLALVICSTWYDLMTLNLDSRKEMFLIFSAYSNMKHLTNTSVERDTLHCLHGIRSISMAWIILGHRYIVDTVMLPAMNNIDGVKFMQTRGNAWIFAAIFSVDTFFMLSGLLVSYVFLNAVKERGSMNFVVFYIHRFVRTTPALVAMVLLQGSLFMKMGDGPLWSITHLNDCRVSWWTTLFYVKNYYIETSCLPQIWYLAADMQIYWFSPLLLLPLWKNPRKARFVLFAALFLGWLIPFLQGYIEKLRFFVLMPNSPDKALGDQLKLYFQTQNRFAPWVVGAGLGYVLHNIRFRQIKFRMSKFLVAAMWMTICALLIWCVLSLFSYVKPNSVYDRFTESMYNSVVHIAWAFGLSLLIFACITGYGGPVNWFFSLGMWQPVSRLTYCMYLVHFTVQVNSSATLRTPLYFSHSTAIPHFCSDLIISIILATILCIMFESPIIMLERIFLRRDKEMRTTQKEELKQNIEKGGV